MDRIGYKTIFIEGASFCEKNKHIWMKYIKIFSKGASEWWDDLSFKLDCPNF